MAVSDPDCPFHLCWRLGVEVVGSTARLPVPVLYDATHNVAIVSPGYDLEDYEDGADWLLSVAVAPRQASA